MANKEKLQQNFQEPAIKGSSGLAHNGLTLQTKNKIGTMFLLLHSIRFFSPLGMPLRQQWPSTVKRRENDYLNLHEAFTWKGSTQSNSKGDFKFILVHNKNAAQQNFVSATAAQTLNVVNHQQFPFASAQTGPSWGSTGVSISCQQSCAELLTESV